MASRNPSTPEPRGDEAGRQNVDHGGSLINGANIIQGPEEQLALFGTDTIRVTKLKRASPAADAKVKPAAKAKGNGAASGKPRLLVDGVNPDQTVAQLRDAFAESDQFYDRGVPVRVIFDPAQGGAVALRMDSDAVVLAAHKLTRPYAIKTQKDAGIVEVDARLPKSVASMYLTDRGEWRLPILNGIASAPLLRDDGSIRSARGYDPESGFWLEDVPDVEAILPESPTRQDAEKALLLIRKTFRTFCFADANMIEGPSGISLVDIGQPPAMDESAFLTVLLTAVCRPSLHVAPGALFTAAETSGAGTGKGKLARCICAIAFGRQPAAVTAGSGVEELEKRIAAKLIESAPAILVDNVNGAALKSDLLASAITERPAEIRVLGRTEMARLNPSAFMVITGNGLQVSEDLARRFIDVRFDARTEDPEARPFQGDIVAQTAQRRSEFLCACLTIWRWGRQTRLNPGKALGGFEQWAQSVRDPLLALGCKDPVERIAEAKANDPRRQKTAEIFSAWWEAHEDAPMAAAALDQSVLCLIDPQNRGRQYVARFVASLAGVRLAGFVMSKQELTGKWTAATYALQKTSAANSHRNS